MNIVTPAKTDPVFKGAAETIIPFGVFACQTIAQVAGTDRGLLYLDWARGKWKDAPQLIKAIGVYLADPAIAKRLRDARVNQRARERDDRRFREWIAK